MFWLFASKGVKYIEDSCERLLWGFWDREVGEKQRKNWRAFIRLFNQIKPFDVVVFQIAKTGDIHAIGIVKNTFYDDQTPVDVREVKKVLFPWRVSFSMMIFSKEPFIRHFINIENYVDGYGIGELPEHEFRRIFDAIRRKANIKINLM